MDEEFEHLSVSPTEEWAILDENSEPNEGNSDKFCFICGVELDQNEYTRASCPVCLVCYSCFLNYPSATYPLVCEHTRGQDSHQTSFSSIVSSNSETDVIVCQPPAKTNDTDRTEAHSGCVGSNNGEGASQQELTKSRTEEEDSSIQNAALPVSSSPLLIPSLARSGGSLLQRRRHSLSCSDYDGVASAGSTDSDHQVITPTGLQPLVSCLSKPTDDLTAKLADFDVTSGYVCCPPKPMPTLAYTARPMRASSSSGGSGGCSPPATANLLNLGSFVGSRSPPPSPPSSSSLRNPSTGSGSPMNSAAQFLKHSATALNNFDLLPMQPWEGVSRETNVPAASSPVGVSPPGKASTQQHGKVLPTQMTADPLLSLPIKFHFMEDDKFRALLTPKPLPKCVIEASRYNLR